MTKKDFARQVRRTTVLTVGLVAALVFGIVLIVVDGDWIPGGIAVIAALIGLTQQIPVIRRLCGEGPPSSTPRSTPVR